ncbi:MAG: EF-P lysine aminoacylase EpmA [Desulfobacterota bacterium]|jgi:lysyl-tRNA synthetase class 2|nr:EF-P lysine aminoacylase EpmA [Thermodesulfobacteriota bacterium]
MSPGSNDPSSLRERETLAAKKPNLRLRAGLNQAIRRFFTERGYLEVETPILIPAPAPELHIDAIRAGDGFLHTSPELCMKRLLAAGFPRIFQICKCFRHAERGGRHLPEFTLLEWYRAETDYLDLMEECEELIAFVLDELRLSPALEFQGKALDLQRPWNRLTVQESFMRYASTSLEQAMASGRFDEILSFEVEPSLGFPKPVFLHRYPSPLGALARLSKQAPGFAERFELYAAGVELANAFSELTDPVEQTARFEKELAQRKRQGKAVTPMPEKFLRSLPFMPESAGIALGVDRLLMLLTNRTEIDSVVSFTPEDL